MRHRNELSGQKPNCKLTFLLPLSCLPATIPLVLPAPLVGQFVARNTQQHLSTRVENNKFINAFACELPTIMVQNVASGQGSFALTGGRSLKNTRGWKWGEGAIYICRK